MLLCATDKCVCGVCCCRWHALGQGAHHGHLGVSCETETGGREGGPQVSCAQEAQVLSIIATAPGRPS